jgi:hypothetical protein
MTENGRSWESVRVEHDVAWSKTGAASVPELTKLTFIDDGSSEALELPNEALTNKVVLGGTVARRKGDPQQDWGTWNVGSDRTAQSLLD